MRSFFNSLVFKISFTIIIIETIALTILGIYYVKRFGNQIDQQIESEISIPGTLMNLRALNYDAVQDKSALQRLIGETVVEAIVFRRDGMVFYTSNSDHEGKQAEMVLKEIDFLTVNSETLGTQIQQFKNGGKVYFANITPIVSNKKHIGYLYIKIDTSNSEKEKRNIARLFTLGSFLCILLTTVALIALIHLMTGSRISKILHCLEEVREGNLKHRVVDVESRDEIGEISRSVNAMIEEVENRTTERDAAERTLRESEEKYRQLIENSNDAIFIAQDGRIVFSNHRTSDMFGYSSETLKKMNLIRFVHPDYQKLVMDRHFRRLSGEKNLPTTYSFKIIRKNRAELTVQLSTVTVEWEGKPATLNFIQDITEQKRLEEMMIQNEKMMSVGGLAAGMAHEINNPLASVMQTAEVMANRLSDLGIPANKKAADKAGITLEALDAFMEARAIPRMLTTIRESSKRVAEIVDNMLSFARKSEADVSPHALDVLLDKILDLAATDYDLKKAYDFKKISIDKNHEANLPLVICEGSKIQQVLLNLIRNGAQAMQVAGTDNPGFIFRTYFEKERNMVCMEIQDNGPGMDDATRKRVFEPFFTTKPIGVGTGLGLSVSYFIITENHNGEMDVESQPGAGAKFIIRLPAA